MEDNDYRPMSESEASRRADLAARRVDIAGRQILPCKICGNQPKNSKTTMMGREETLGLECNIHNYVIISVKGLDWPEILNLWNDLMKN